MELRLPRDQAILEHNTRPVRFRVTATPDQIEELGRQVSAENPPTFGTGFTNKKIETGVFYKDRDGAGNFALAHEVHNHKRNFTNCNGRIGVRTVPDDDQPGCVIVHVKTEAYMETAGGTVWLDEHQLVRKGFIAKLREFDSALDDLDGEGQSGYFRRPLG